MRRDLDRFQGTEFDVVVVGGGIYGICTAWYAAHCGLRVALLERGDFCGATSANSLKLVHGGFRYIQHLDVVRMRDSIRERRVLLGLAPHLVHPIPFLIPTYGHGMRGKEVLLLGLLLYNLVALDRNRGLRDRARRVPWGEVLSRAECLRRFPGLEEKRLTGGVAFYDGQMYNPPRLALSYLKSAVAAGAEVANYTEVTGFRRQGNRVTGVSARDAQSGREFEVCGQIVVNAGGPWVEGLLNRAGLSGFRPRLSFSKDLYLVVNRRLVEDYALFVESSHKDPNALVSRGQRHLFVIPWRDATLIGSSHVAYEDPPDEFAVSEQDVSELLAEVNRSYPALALRREDVSLWNAGMVPMGENEPGVTDLRLAKRYRIIDHEAEEGIAGLVSVAGVRWTTSGDVGERVVELVRRKIGASGPRPDRASLRVYGGDMESFTSFMEEGRRHRPEQVAPAAMEHLLRNHGSAYGEVLSLLSENPELGRSVGASKVLRAEILHGVREEMACRLADVVFRRTDLGTAGDPGEDLLRDCAALMGAELGWDEARIQKELEEVRGAFP